MDDGFLVGGLERVGDLHCEVDRVVDRQRLPIDAVIQRLALQILHDDEWVPGLFGDFVDGADVRMAQRRGCVGLSLEP
jgi:hypothetical protein